MLRRELKTSMRAMLLWTLVLGLIYPLVLTVTSQLAMPGRANGSLQYVDGKAVGSSLIGQDFQMQVVAADGKKSVDSDGEPVLTANPRYFQSRPSATGYSPATTYFRNLGPNSQELSDEMAQRAADYVALEARYGSKLAVADVPVDAVTSSGSGVDPHISVANARLQSARVAKARGLTFATTKRLVREATNKNLAVLFGEPGVNVLALNLALDRLGAQ